MSSLLDTRLVLPSQAGAPSVAYPPGTQAATLPPLFTPPLADRDPPAAQLVRHSGMVDDTQRCLLPGVDRFIESSSGGNEMRILGEIALAQAILLTTISFSVAWSVVCLSSVTLVHPA